ncbi:MAG: hypothetical protein LBV23_03845 [Deltaproteobacteria bacterium]|jgi:nicotinamide-nucleotide amidase|nr:hypothetical protein [Deltaproteobacteria bacterium]
MTSSFSPIIQSNPSKPITASILATGSELMVGKNLDTNSAWLSSFLNSRGVTVVRHLSVGDELERLIESFRECFKSDEITLVTGGLGPTEDDLTRLAAARAFGLDLEYKTQLAQEIEAYIRRRGYPCPQNNLRQAWLPKGALIAPNKWGTAPAFALEGPERLMVFMPGVPQEMKNIAESWIDPKLKEKFSSRLGLVRTTVLRAAGLGESVVDKLLDDLVAGAENPKIGFLAGLYETRILISVKAADETEADRLDGKIISEIVKRLGSHYVGRNEETIASSVCAMIEEKNLRLGLVDSLSEGRAGEPFVKLLKSENLAGSFIVSPNDLKAAQEALFEKFGASIVISLFGKISDRNPVKEGELVIDYETKILRKDPKSLKIEEVLRRERPSGGPKDTSLSRAASTMAFELWNWLKGKELK